MRLSKPYDLNLSCREYNLGFFKNRKYKNPFISKKFNHYLLIYLFQINLHQENVEIFYIY
ncbi:hypothetical protein BpHYR1_002739 [Brachionus plicatilis]|uniref:Uncharacterized protein n=1 Tax=Brachionus plicatilis TaxID=10195 RepID=A0A3M7Q0M0_BRAPC|nr:hypothetical protein BpHYR1_002739 [Brachionus plicatilis]